MASFFDKVALKTASDSRSQINLDCQHLTTSDFFQLQPAYFRELIPGQKINVNMRSQARLAGMPLPSYVNMYMHQRAFFVSMESIFPAFNDFITDTQHATSNNVTGLVTTAPRFQMLDIINVFRNPIYSSTSSASVDNYDFAIYTSEGVTEHRIFTAKGRQLYKILVSLGYNISWNMYEASSYSQYLSALPLLAYVRVFLDWYWPSAYANDSDKMACEAILHRDNSLTPALSSSDLFTLVTWLGFVPYDQDYFTAAFDNPVGPVSGSYSSSSIVDVSDNSTNTSYRDLVTNASNGQGFPSNGTPYVEATAAQGAYFSHITQFVLDSLKRLTDYATRHRLVGARSVDRFLSRFGIKLTDKWRSIYIGGNEVPLMVEDVTATSDTALDSSTDGSRLGDYAGKGGMNQMNAFSFDFDTDKFGYVLVMTSLVPRTSIVQGIRRETLHLNKLDFFTPEFDALGNRAILPAEVFISPNGGNMNSEFLFSSVFGFTPQYSEYKVAYDTLSGDFRCGSINKAGFASQGWHSFRIFDDNAFDDDSANACVHSKSFVTGDDFQQYERLFYDAPNAQVLGVRADHFIVNHLFNISSSIPAKPLYDTYDFESNGNKILMDVNGKSLN